MFGCSLCASWWYKIYQSSIRYAILAHSFLITCFFLIQMHHSVRTIRFLVNLIDSSPLAMVVTQTTDLSPAGTASSQVHIQMQLWSDWVAEWRASHLWRYSIVGREVCFHGLLNCCYRTVQIRVRECQGYYVYELNRHLPKGLAAIVQARERYRAL